MAQNFISTVMAICTLVISISLLYGSQAGYGTFLATLAVMPGETNALVQVYVGLAGRTLLQASRRLQQNG